MAGRSEVSRKSSPGQHAVIRDCRRIVAHGFLHAALLSGFINLLQLTVPLFMLQVHDRIILSASIDSLKVLVALALGAITLFGILEFIRSMMFQAVAASVVGRLNVPAIEAALAISVEQGASKGTEVLRDLGDLRGFMTGTAFAAPFEALWSPIFLAVMFSFHPYYGLVGVVGIILLIALGLLSDLICRPVLKEASAAQVDSIGMIGSTLRQSEVIEGMGILPALLARWRKVNFAATELLYQGSRRSRAMHAITRSVRYVMQIAVLAMGAYLIIGQEASPGSMIGGTLILGRLLLPFDTITADWRAWVFAGSAWKRIREVVDTYRSPRETEPTPRPNGDLVVDRLVFAPAGAAVPVLKGVSFSLAPGEVLGIAGPSAAGKSTLARLLVGVLKPTAGGVYLNGHNVFLWERASFGEAVGYLPQSISLIEGTVRENIARLRDADPRDVIAAARAADVHDVIGRLPLGYDTSISEASFSLSGGQKQRIALARALFGRPALIVLDEPNSNLDGQGQHALMSAMAEARMAGTTIVVVTHQPAFLRDCNRMIVLQNGLVVHQGPPEAVMAELRARTAEAAQRTDDTQAPVTEAS